MTLATALHAAAVTAVVLMWIALSVTSGHPIAVALACSAACVAGIFSSGRTGIRALWFNAAVIIPLIGIAGSYFEATHDPRDYEQTQLVPDSVIPGEPRPERFSSRAVFSYEGEVIFDVLYTSEPQGMRASPPGPAQDARACALLFGCSFVYGVGVNDDETLGHYIEKASKSRLRARNFGAPGTGPHHMLDNIENGFVEQHTDCDPELAIYQVISAHVDRAAGRLTATGDHFGPRFVLTSDGNLIRKGNHSKIYGLLPEFAFGWAVRNWVDRTFYDPIGAAERRLFSAIVSEAQRALRERYPGLELQVVYWDRDASYQSIPPPPIAALVAQTQPNTHLVSKILPPRDDWVGAYQIPHDLHPTPLANRLMAEYFVTEVLAEGATD